jgi:tetratricopeptide (TPR) repeat protein
MTKSADPRPALAAIAFALLAASTPALADDVQEASRLLRAGQPQQALERVNRALAAKPKDAQARFLKGLIFAEQGNSREATDIFLALTKDYPELPEPYNNLAVIYASQGQYDKARSALEQSIRTHPSYATAYENLGDVYAKLASQAYDKALQIDSANPGAKNKLALVRDLVGGNAPAVAGAVKPSAVAVAPKEPAKPPAVVALAAPEKAAEKTVEKPAAEKPAAPKPAAAPARSTSTEVLDAINAWAKAWSARNVNAYLASYSRDFKAPGGESRAEWEASRRQRVSGPRSISVAIDAPRIAVAGDTATATFRQRYRSDVIKGSTTTKTLVFTRVDGRWLIQQERIGN